MRRHVWLAVALTAAVLPRSALAQPRSRQGNAWVRGAVVVTTQPEGQDYCPYLCGPLGGGGIGVSAGVGVRTTPRLVLLAEATRASRLEGPQQVRLSQGFLDLSATHRDTILAGGVAVSLLNPTGRLSPDLVGLVGVARRRTSRSGVRRFPFTGDEPQVYEDELVDTVPSVGAGLDLQTRVNELLNIVPFVRMHYMLDSDDADGGAPKRGVGSLAAQAGVGLAVVF